MLAFLQQRWFLLTLIVALWAGMVHPNWMRPIADWLPSNVIVAAVTFVMALPLETNALWNAARRPGPAWLAVSLNSGVAPPLGWLASLLLPAELATGVIVATAVPCTLATAAVWTRRAGGNDAVAFLVTVITNLACFLVVPAWLRLLVGTTAQDAIRRTEIDYGRIVVGLILLVVLPLIVAQLMRQWRSIGDWAAQHKQEFSSAAQIGVLLMVLMGAVHCGERLNAATNGSVLTAGNVGVMIFAVVLVHVTLLALGFVLSGALGFNRGDAIAVAFSGSQKTMMVGAYLALAIGPLAILPMVAYHAAQLVIDTMLADWLRSRAQDVTTGSESVADFSAAV
jgi:sodium/bile acid cotransporter 7